MFAGFNLKTNRDFKEYYKIGESMYRDMNISIRSQIEDYINPIGSIDGSRLQEDWFPEIDADIFISHSHDDEKIAIGFAGWLKSEFNIKAFIDSCVWGYSNELLKKIDDEYCKDENTNLYDYNDRNYSTSHVHMMLLMSLYKMMDKSECIFLLNTSNSIKSIEEGIGNNLKGTKTESPWIYSEIVGTNLIRKKALKEYRENKIDIINESLTFANKKVKLNILYDTDLRDLEEVDDFILDKWKMNYINKKIEYPLDYLYFNIKPSIIKEWSLEE